MKNNFFKKKQLPGGPQNIFLLVGLFVGLIVVLTYLADYTRHVQSFSYSTFLSAVEQDKVKKVHISGQYVRGTLKDGAIFETIIGENQRNWDLLREHNVELIVSVPSQQFQWWHLLILCALLMVPLAFWYFLRQSKNMGNGGGNIFSIGKSRAKMFAPSAIKINFDSVAGAQEAKEDLKDIVDFLKNPEKYRRLGAKITRGVLLVGEPGNGKTLLAKAVAGEASCPFFSIAGSDFIEVFVGVGAARVRDLFAQARKHAPSIIFIDEIDAVGRHRGSGLGGGHDEREQTLNQLLTEMDGFETQGGNVIVIAATNRADVLDKALLRPGRFDRRIEVPYPDLASREMILNVHIKNVKVDPALDIRKIARGTPGFTGADLENLINEAALHATKDLDKKMVSMEDFEQARDKILLGKALSTMVLSEKERKVVAYHEAGHALVRLLLPESTDPLHKITIIPRGRALGVTHSLPERDKYSQTKEEMLATIAAALGGRAAEELVFKELATGAYSDFIAATDLARKMVCFYGMSEALGPVVYNQRSEDFQYSEKTAEKIDQEVQHILDSSYKRAVTLLANNRDKLDILSLALLEKETMYASEIYPLLGLEPREDFKLT